MAKYVDLDPDAVYTLKLTARGFAFQIQLLGLALDDKLASANGWADPLAIFDSGNPSWYQDPASMFNVVHTLDAPDGAELHIDPFGPFNQPAHFLLQVVPGWLFGTINYGTVSCSLSAGGCSSSGH